MFHLKYVSCESMLIPNIISWGCDQRAFSRFGSPLAFLTVLAKHLGQDKDIQQQLRVNSQGSCENCTTTMGTR